MKKSVLFFLLVLVVGASVCFADGFELGGTVLVLSGEGQSIFGGGLNLASTSYFTQNIGLGIFGNIMYAPASGVSLIAIDTLIGPAFRIVDNGTLSLPISAGLYAVYAFAFGEGGAAKGFNVGAGGNITAQVKFSQSMYFYARFQADYGFLAGGELFITPSIGIGF